MQCLVSLPAGCAMTDGILHICTKSLMSSVDIAKTLNPKLTLNLNPKP